MDLDRSEPRLCNAPLVLNLKGRLILLNLVNPVNLVWPFFLFSFFLLPVAWRPLCCGHGAGQDTRREVQWRSLDPGTCIRVPDVGSKILPAIMFWNYLITYAPTLYKCSVSRGLCPRHLAATHSDDLYYGSIDASEMRSTVGYHGEPSTDCVLRRTDALARRHGTVGRWVSSRPDMRPGFGLLAIIAHLPGRLEIGLVNILTPNNKKVPLAFFTYSGSQPLCDTTQLCPSNLSFPFTRPFCIIRPYIVFCCSG
jgi:hypothetical protein